MSEEFKPHLPTVSIYVRELLQEKMVTPEESCVVLLDVISDLIVDFAKGDVGKLGECTAEWSSRICSEAARKSFKRFPPPPRPGLVVPLPPRAAPVDGPLGSQ